MRDVHLLASCTPAVSVCPHPLSCSKSRAVPRTSSRLLLRTMSLGGRSSPTLSPRESAIAKKLGSPPYKSTRSKFLLRVALRNQEDDSLDPVRTNTRQYGARVMTLTCASSGMLGVVSAHNVVDTCGREGSIKVK